MTAIASVQVGDERLGVRIGLAEPVDYFMADHARRRAIQALREEVTTAPISQWTHPVLTDESQVQWEFEP